MTTEQDIDELLRQDEALLKAKRKRLKAFGAAIDELRRATDAASKVADELIDAGDLSRADLGRVFKLSKSERAALAPARRGSGADAPVQLADAAAGEPGQSDQSDDQAA